MSNTPNFTRRQFVQAAAVTAGPLILTRSSLGGLIRQPADAGLGIGMIGCGKRAFELSGGLTGRADAKVLAVCDVDTTRREAMAKRIAKQTSSTEPKQFVDYRELLSMPGIDAVVISTPDHWHAAQVIDAAKAKKDIYCEKPMSLNIHEAKMMIDAVRKHDRVFQTGSQQRTEYGGCFRKACEFVRAGRIGRVYSVNVGVGESSKPCDLGEESMEAGLDWDRWLGPAPQRPYHSELAPRGVHNHYPNWRLYREYSGGMMTDFGAHHYDIAQWGLDMDSSGPVEIRPPADEKSMYGAQFYYPNGVVMTHGGPHGTTFIGEKGTIYVTRDRLESIPGDLVTKPLEESEPKLPEAKSHLDNWFECIASRQRCICDVEVGARSVTVCHLANLVYWNRRALKWDPQKWEFPGDAQANGWREYERRKGYELPGVG